MFQAFPLMGLGQGTFYAMSGIQSFAKSRFLGEIQGENAHNYFLQTLTETGLIGAIILCAVLVLPWLKCRDKKDLYPAYGLLLAIALGNLFAHALLVRENFFLLCAVISLLYVISSQPQQGASHSVHAPLRWKLTGLVLISLTLMMATQEIFRSFTERPYVYGAKCYIGSPLKNNEWTTGLIDVQIPQGTKQIILHLGDVHPDVVKNRLGMAIDLLDAQSKIIYTQQVSINQLGPQVVRVPLELSQSHSETPTRAKVVLSRCFTPRNFGVSSDRRRLGIVVKELEFLP